jgi:hypothetical protein
MMNTIIQVLNKLHKDTELGLRLKTAQGDMCASAGETAGECCVLQLTGGFSLEVYGAVGDEKTYRLIEILVNGVLENNASSQPIELILSGNFKGDVSEYIPFSSNTNKLVISIETQYNDDSKNILDSVFVQNSTKCFRIGENQLVLIVELKKIQYDDAVEISTALLDDLTNELAQNVYIGISGMFRSLEGVKDAYSQAKCAKDIAAQGKRSKLCQFKDALIEFAYEGMPDVCVNYLNNLDSIKGIDEFFSGEFVEIFNVFLQRNLNISDTAREVFLHRNSLKYKIDKLYKLTGLDIRRFNDAVAFKFLLSHYRNKESSYER